MIGAAIMVARIATGETLPEACLEAEEVALRRETGALIAQGRCPDALALALRGGDLQLAVNIRSYCGSQR